MEKKTIQQTVVKLTNQQPSSIIKKNLPLTICLSHSAAGLQGVVARAVQRVCPCAAVPCSRHFCSFAGWKERRKDERGGELRGRRKKFEEEGRGRGVRKKEAKMKVSRTLFVIVNSFFFPPFLFNTIYKIGATNALMQLLKAEGEDLCASGSHTFPAHLIERLCDVFMDGDEDRVSIKDESASFFFLDGLHIYVQ